jgi:hypothetical protein
LLYTLSLHDALPIWRLRDGRYAVPVHAALWSVFGHVRVGPLPEVFMVGYTYANPANARNRARSLYPMG